MTTPERLRRRQRIESLLIAILCALLVAAWIYFRAEDDEQARKLQNQANRNSQIISCLTDWAADQTDALQDRDVLVRTARDAELDMWRAIHHWLATAAPGADRAPMLQAIARFKEILRRLQQTEAINPYPDITECLPLPFVASGSTAAYRLAAYDTGSVLCWGERVTIRGTGSADVIHGTDGPDVIRTFGGGDVVHGGGGNDLICGGRGDDTLNGGQGYDRVRGQRGSDFCIQAEVTGSC